MKMSTLFVLGSMLFCASLLGQSGYTFVAIPANNCIQTDLISTFPEGMFTAVNPLLTPFNIATVPATCGITGTGACDFNDSLGAEGDAQSLTIDVAIPHVTHVYTLMNAYAPPVGAQVATIKFVGSGGASIEYPLVAGKDIRDFYHGSFANTLTNGISGVHAVSAFKCVDPANCLGAGGTGNVNTGSHGLYVVDEQVFTLSPEFATQVLVRIIITDTNNGSTPILLGITTKSL